MKYGDSLYYSLLSVAIAFVFSLAFIAIMGANEPDKILLLIFGTIASGVSGFAWWYFFMERRGGGSVRGAVLTGLVTVATAHFFAFYSLILYYNICHALTGGCLNSLKEPPENPLTGLIVSLGFAGLSLIFFVGWFTLPAGVAASILYRAARMRFKK